VYTKQQTGNNKTGTGPALSRHRHAVVEATLPQYAIKIPNRWVKA